MGKVKTMSFQARWRGDAVCCCLASFPLETTAEVVFLLLLVQWGMDGAEDDEIGLTEDGEGVPSFLVQRIDLTVDEYQKQFDVLMLMLQDQVWV